MNEATHISNQKQTASSAGWNDFHAEEKRYKNLMTRVDMVGSWYFGRGGNPFLNVSTSDGLAFALDCCYGPLMVIESCSDVLAEDAHRLTYRLVGSGVIHERVLALQFECKTLYIDIAVPVNIYLHLLLCLNELLAPYYELRRYSRYIAANGDIILPLKPAEWETLTKQKGARKVEAAFQRITERTELAIRPDLLTKERWWL
ncbi:hypothetical protein ACFOET_10955 [Parapedobacter deserti]|uniref:Uncharacterized protein n=1 Tax=Parapedobacter deserti TaxID=1912957 RepID=A0ABV7JJG7_9SPHI